jgi:hypothetical protein
VVDVRFTGFYLEGHFGALYDVAETTVTTVKIFFQTITENITVHLFVYGNKNILKKKKKIWKELIVYFPFTRN